MTKTRYRFEFRTLSDPPEFYEMEAGPFEPMVASMFGQTEALKKCAITKRVWVCRYEPIIDAPGAPNRMGLFVIAILVGVLAGLLLWWRLA